MVGDAASVSSLRSALRDRLPEHMVPSAFVVLDSLPLGPNGKVDRAALPAPEGRPELEQAYVAPRTSTEEIVASIWGEVLGLDQVGVHDDFFDLGGHSLLVVQVLTRMQEMFAAEIPVRELFEFPTVAGLALVVERRANEGRGCVAPPIEVVARKDGSALSFAQQRLWFLDQLVPGSAFYNIASAWRLEGPLDAAALEAALGEVVARHESLRTTFVSVDGKPLQRVKEPWAFELTAVDVSGEPCPEEAASLQVAEEAARPFDLARGPLLRAQLLRLSDEDHVLILVVHHIVSDGWSSGVLWRDCRPCTKPLSRGSRRRFLRCRCNMSISQPGSASGSWARCWTSSSSIGVRSSWGPLLRSSCQQTALDHRCRALRGAPAGSWSQPKLLSGCDS